MAIGTMESVLSIKVVLYQRFHYTWIMCCFRASHDTVQKVNLCIHTCICTTPCSDVQFFQEMIITGGK